MQAWDDALPPPPREVYRLIDRARLHGLWLVWARYTYHARRQGGRYKLTLPRGIDALCASDDLADIAAHLDQLDREDDA